MRHFDLRRERFRIDRKSVILRRDRYSSGFQIFDRLVAAAMSEFQFESAAAVGKTEHLMPQTNPKDRLFPHQPAHCVVCVTEDRGIAGTVRKKNSVRIERENFFCRCRRRHHRHAKTILPEPAQNIFFDAIVVGNNSVVYVGQ